MGALKAVSPVVWIVLLAVVAVVALGFLLWRLKSGGSTGTPFTGLLSNPLFQRLVTHIATTAQATHHATMDAAIVKVVPAAAPFVPLLNAVADKVDAKIIAAVTPSTTERTAPPTPTVDLSQLLTRLEALEARLQAPKS